ncbi:MAG: hypothetical protein ACK55X_08605 [Synechococcaceae cyanobacterium]|jgi:hypothetical protein
MTIRVLAATLMLLPLAAAAAANAAPAASSVGLDFLLGKAAESYCGFMDDQTPQTMTTFDRGLYEGMALGFVMGQYPEQSGVLADVEDESFEKGFYGRIRSLCPTKAFL